MQLYKMRIFYICLIGILVGLMLPVRARADHIGTIIYYNCDTPNDQIVIEYRGGVNEAFDELMANKGPNAWYPWDLVTVDKNERAIVKVKTILKTCNLSDGKYEITIGPEPGNWNIQGRLGARMSAWVKVSKNGKEIIRKSMEDLWDWNKPIISKIVLKAKEPQPVVIEVKADDFYK